MNNVRLYSKVTWLQRRNVRDLLNEYDHKINWKIQGDRSIDLGCGDGGVTVDVLRKYLPNNYDMLIGCDISHNMVHFASDHRSDERTNFVLWDMSSEIPKHLLKSFDHVFSFNAINWVKNQVKVFQNIYDLLKENGDCLLKICSYQPVYETYRELVKNNKWKDILGDVEQYISPYHDSMNPEQEIKTIITKVGFKNVFVKSRTLSFVYQNFETLMNAMLSLHPFKIPENMLEEFSKDYTEVFVRINFKDEAKSDFAPAYKNYGSIMVYGTK